MEELYKVMDDLLDVEFQMKSGIDLLKELEEFYMLEKETEESEARKVAVLMKGYLQSMKSNLREIIRYIDDTTLEKSNNEKKGKQESASTISEEVQDEVITEYCNAIFSSGADTEEFFYRLGLKDGLNLKSTVKSTLEMLSGNIHGGEPKDEE